MFGFGKKQKRSIDIAELIVREVGGPSNKFVSQVDRLISGNPHLAPLRSRIIDEAQWISVAAGIIVVKLTADPSLSQSILDDIVHFYRGCSVSGSSQAAFTENDLKNIKSRLDAYWVRFNRRMTLDESPTLTAAIEDVANEAMTYITGKSRHTEIDFDSLTELQKRTVPKDELESWVAELLNASLGFFKYQLQQHNII